MTAAPRDDRSTDALVDAANALFPPRRGIPGLLGALASLVTSPPPSTGPCFDKPKGMKRS
jgi:hypothetical protein